MFIDLHMHEMRNSGDSFLPLEEIVEIAKKKGLDAICITDHDSMDIRDFAQEYSRKTGFPIFVGIEFYSSRETSLPTVSGTTPGSGSAPGVYRPCEGAGGRLLQRPPLPQ